MIRPLQFSDVAALHDWVAAPLTEALRLSMTSQSAPSSSRSKTSATFAMPVDVYSDRTQAMVVAALPGVHPDDIDVSVQRNSVTIRAAARGQHAPQQNGEVTWYISELHRGAFERSIAFPFAIDEQAVDAQFANGVLRLVLPRREQDRPQRIPVKIGGETPLSLEASTDGEVADATPTEASDPVAD